MTHGLHDGTTLAKLLQEASKSHMLIVIVQSCMALANI